MLILSITCPKKSNKRRIASIPFNGQGSFFDRKNIWVAASCINLFSRWNDACIKWWKIRVETRKSGERRSIKWYTIPVLMLLVCAVHVVAGGWLVCIIKQRCGNGEGSRVRHEREWEREREKEGRDG